MIDGYNKTITVLIADHSP